MIALSVPGRERGVFHNDWLGTVWYHLCPVPYLLCHLLLLVVIIWVDVLCCGGRGGVFHIRHSPS